MDSLHLRQLIESVVHLDAELRTVRAHADILTTLPTQAAIDSLRGRLDHVELLMQVLRDRVLLLASTACATENREASP